MSAAETIYALASGQQRAAIAVIRLSGDQAFEALRVLQGALSEVGVLAPRLLRDPHSGEEIDRAMTVRFKAPHSYTGEDMAEVHCHGSPAVIEGIFEAWRATDRLCLRAAEAGEFTRRALLAGKIDATRAEGLIDLIQAETHAQRRQALAQSEGALYNLYQGWSVRLFACLAEKEARIDFPDEDLHEEHEVASQNTLKILHDEIHAHLALAPLAARIRLGASVVLSGAPNVGKSSLLNRLAGRDVAIVSSRPGTTRDLLSLRLDIKGCVVEVLDTAGLRHARSQVEAEGIARAQRASREADFVVKICDAKDFKRDFKKHFAAKNIDSETRWDFLVYNKADLLPKSEQIAQNQTAQEQGVFFLSAKTDEGSEAFVRELARCLAQTPCALAPTRARHRAALSQACAALSRTHDSLDWALQAQGLREACTAFDRLLGKRDIEQLLDKIFSEFCIGK